MNNFALPFFFLSFSLFFRFVVSIATSVRACFVPSKEENGVRFPFFCSSPNLQTYQHFRVSVFFFFCKEIVFSLLLVRPRSEESAAAAAAAAAAMLWTRRSPRARLV